MTTVRGIWERRRQGPPRASKAGARIATAPSLWAKALGWSAHAYTATGLIAAAAITALIVQGTPEAFRWSFILMAVATFIDATDGTWARRVRVKEVTPGFDGRRLDDLIDWLTYTCLPLFLLWRAEILPSAWSGWLLAPLLASAYGFCQVSIKTDDGYFLGFPSYWNIVAFYLYVLQPAPAVSLGLILALSILTFVPIRYLYPSQPGRLNRISTLLAIPWVALLGIILWGLDPASPISGAGVYALALISLLYPAYYFAMSWAITARRWRGTPPRGRLTA